MAFASAIKDQALAAVYAHAHVARGRAEHAQPIRPFVPARPRACSFFVWVATPVRYLACGLSVWVLSVKFGVTAPRRAYEAPVACAFDWGHETVFPRLRMRRIRTQPLARDSKVLYPSPMSTDAYATVGKGYMYPSRLSTDSYGARRTYASHVHVIRMSHVPRRREVSMSYVADGSVRSRRQGFHVP